MPRTYNLNAEETALLEEFKASVYKPFLPRYGDKWDEDLWTQESGAYLVSNISDVGAR